MKNILITGGAGFIGSNLSLALKKRGYNVTVLDNLSKQIHTDNPEKSPLFTSIYKKVNFIKGDVLNRSDWELVIKNQDAIIHLAAETGTGQSMYQICNYSEVNILGTALMWDVLANSEHTIKKVIIASSRAIYGEGKYFCEKHQVVYPDSRKDADMSKGDFHVKCPACSEIVKVLPTSEDSRVHPTSIYGFTKKAQEELSMIAGHAINIPVVSFRFQNVYGPGQSLSNPYTGILSIFTTRIKNNHHINIFEDGEEGRDFVYIDDVVDATILGLENEKASFESFNVGSGNCTSVNEVAKKLNVLYGINVDLNITGNYRLGDIRNNFADLTKVKNMLGFYPKIDLTEGLSRFVKWVNDQEIVKDDFDFSIQIMKEKRLLK